MAKFKIGAAVCLRGGGPRMYVSIPEYYVGGGRASKVLCHWWYGNCRLHERYDPGLLRHC